MGYKQKQTIKTPLIKKQKVRYWANKEISLMKTRRKKLKDVYLTGFIKWARNKTTGLMSYRKISSIINSVLNKRNEVDKRNKPLTISYRTINNYLRQYFGKPRKIRKTFFLSEELMDK